MRVTHVITRLIVGGAQENTIASVLGLRLKHGLDARLISGPTTGQEGSLETLVTGTPELLTNSSVFTGTRSSTAPIIFRKCSRFPSTDFS